MPTSGSKEKAKVDTVKNEVNVAFLVMALRLLGFRICFFTGGCLSAVETEEDNSSYFGGGGLFFRVRF